MRVNEQFYREVSSILWREFALYVCPIGRWTRPHKEWYEWMQNRNPRSIASTRHLHIRLADRPAMGGLGADQRSSNRDHTFLEIQEILRYYPNLVSVRLQVCVQGMTEPSNRAKIRSVERIMRVVALCEGLDVQIFWEPAAEAKWGEDIVNICKSRIGQADILPRLHREWVEVFPRTYPGSSDDMYRKSRDRKIMR